MENLKIIHPLSISSEQLGFLNTKSLNIVVVSKECRGKTVLVINL